MDAKKVNRQAWAVDMFFTLFMAVMTLNLIIFPACAADSMQTYGIGQVQLTTLSSVTSVVGVFGGIIFGRMLDVRDVRRCIMLFMIIGVILFFIRAYVTSYAAVTVLTFFSGLAIGICQVAGPKVVATWFPQERVGPATTVFTTGAGIGSAGGFALGAFLGIHNSLLAVAIFYLILLIYWIIVGREGPYKVLDENNEAVKLEKGSVKRVYTSKNLWMIIIAYSLAVTSSLLVNTYLVNSFVSRGFSETQASMIGTFLSLARLAGGFLMAYLLAVMKRFHPLLMVCMFGAAVMMLCGWFLPIGINTWIFMIGDGLLFGGSLGLCVGRVPLIPMTGDFGPEVIGTASGFTETIKGIITFVLPIVVTNIFGTRYNAIYIIFAVCCVFVVVCGCWLVPELGEKGKLATELREANESGDS